MKTRLENFFFHKGLVQGLRAV